MGRYQKQSNLNGIYIRNCLSKINDGTKIINPDECKWLVNHWLALYMNRNIAKDVDRFGAEYIPKKTQTFIGKRNITNISRMRHLIQ